MSIKGLLTADNLRKDSADELLKALSKINYTTLSAPNFTQNGNAVKYQYAEAEAGGNKVSVRFTNGYNPLQAQSGGTITTKIEIVTYKDGNASGVRTVAGKTSKSVKSAEKNYQDMLETWKKITKQKQIKFK